MATKLLVLDTAGKIGFAYGEIFSNSGLPFSGVHKLPEQHLTKRLLALQSWLTDVIEGNHITDVWIEKPFVTNSKSEDAIYSMLGYVLASGMAATRCGCHCSLIDIQTWRSELGLPTQGPKNVLADPRYADRFSKRKNGLKDAKRQYVKDRTIDFVVKQGCDPKDDNEADACAIWFCVAQRLRKKLEAPKYDLFGDLDV